MDAEIRAMEERLDNWRLCVRSGVIRHHCGSAEHRYRAGKGDVMESRRVPRLVIDERDGWLIERAWSTLPIRWRWMLKLHYVLQLEKRAVIRWTLKRAEHAIKPWHYKAELLHAVRKLKMVVDTLQFVEDTPRHNLDAVSQDAWNESPKAALARPVETETEPVEA